MMNSHPCSVPVTCIPPDDPELQRKADMLQAALHGQQTIVGDENQQLLLVYTVKGLELQTVHLGKKQPPSLLSTDFVRGNTGYRRFHGGGISQPLARAAGLKPGYRPKVVDCTAGLGVDSFILAVLGCQVTMIERSPLIGALLADGLERAADHPATKEIMARIELRLGNSCEIITTLPERPATIYLDPMYPHRLVSALNKQAMRTIRAVVGDDHDAALLLETALTIAANRVVVKRPQGAPTLNNRQPSHIIALKNSRFDVYLTGISQ